MPRNEKNQTKVTAVWSSQFRGQSFEKLFKIKSLAFWARNSRITFKFLLSTDSLIKYLKTQLSLTGTIRLMMVQLRNHGSWFQCLKIYHCILFFKAALLDIFALSFQKILLSEQVKIKWWKQWTKLPSQNLNEIKYLLCQFRIVVRYVHLRNVSREQVFQVGLRSWTSVFDKKCCQYPHK